VRPKLITIKRLNTPALIEDACALLHELYVHEQNGQFFCDDSSKMLVEIRNTKKVLVDQFIDRSIWFGAFDEEGLVGCIRLSGLDESNQLEADTCARSQFIRANISVDERAHCYGIQTMAIKVHEGTGRIVKSLLLACFKFCQKNQFHLLTFTHNGYLKFFFRKIAFPMKREHAFNYEPQVDKAVNFYFADFKKLEVDETLKKLEDLENESGTGSGGIFKALQTVEAILPTPFYWMSPQGVVLGINELMLKAMGTTREIIGKKPYAFYKPEIAEHILKHNAEVMRKGAILSQEEWVEDVTTKERVCFSSTKAPLYDDEGTILGIVGTSIEITAQKEVEQLRVENERQRNALLEEKEKLIKLAHTVAHDIGSPLSALNMMMHACDELHEKKRTVIKRAIESILDIANNLLSTYRNDEQRAAADIEQRQPLLISEWITQLLSEKKVQYSNHAVRFETEIVNEAQFAFAQMQASQFRRAMSNLINNAVDALANKDHATVTIKLTADAEAIAVTIQDNGKGMSSGVIEKMMNRQSFTEGKANGHGLGLQQVWDTLDNNQGTMSVSSTPNEGTTIQLTFPRIDAASWIAQLIHFVPNSIFVLLDDEESIHGAWDTRFAPYLKLYPNLVVHHFKQGQEALDFFSLLSPKDKDLVVLLSDYELLRQAKNGLQIIGESGIKNAILVTSYYANAQIRDKAMQLGVKILPKQMASIVPLELDENRPGTNFLKAMRNRFPT